MNNFGRHGHVKSIYLLTSLFIIFFFTGCNHFQSPPHDVENLPTIKTRAKANLRYGPSQEFAVITVVPAWQEIDVLGKAWDDYEKNGKPPYYGQWYHVRLNNGEIGYIASNAVKRANKTYVLRGLSVKKKVYAAPGSTGSMEVIRELVPGEKVSLLAHQPAKNPRKRKGAGRGSYDMSKVLFEDGSKGWVYTSVLDWGGVPMLPENPRYTMVLDKDLLTKQFGSLPKEEIIKKIGLPNAHQLNEENEVSYYRNIKMLNEHRISERTVFIYNDNILAFPAGMGEKKLSIRDYLPFSGLTRRLPIAMELQFFSNSIQILSDSEEFQQGFFLSRWMDSLDWWWQILLGLLLIVPALFLFFLILELPLLLGVMGIKGLSRNKGISNLVLVLILYIPVTLLTYAWWLLLMQNVYPFTKGVLIWFIVALGFLLFRIAMVANRINYGRCPSCNHWAAYGIGSTFLGRSQKRELVTSREYNSVTGYARESSEIQTTNKDSFDDALVCGNCGYNWKIRRKESHTSSQPDSSRPDRYIKY